MDIIWTEATLIEALGSFHVVIPKFECAHNIRYNSTYVEKNDIFIAFSADGLPTIRGTKDSHQYVKDALDRGAAFAIVEHEIAGVDNSKLLIVHNSFAILSKMSEYKRFKSKAKFIAITGSAGKTSTKDATVLALRSFGKVFANPGTFNNELGVSLTLASMPDDVEYVVMEVGMSFPNEISPLMPKIRPDLVMINNILPVHLENFDSLDGIADAKLEILDSVKDGMIAIFNADSEYYDYCCTKAMKKGIDTISSFGKNNGKARLLKYELNNNISHVTVSINKDIFSFDTSIVGEHRVLNLLAVLLICNEFDLDPKVAAKQFMNAKATQGRGDVHNVEFNDHQCIIIDDSYNASPVSTIASINHLKMLEHPKKVVILGNMMELGLDEIKYHQSLKPYLIDANLYKVYTIGNLMYELHKILPEIIRGDHFENYVALENALNSIITDDMMILFKGSKSQKLWYVVSKLVNK